jgi:hypothetical protein
MSQDDKKPTAPKPVQVAPQESFAEKRARAASAAQASQPPAALAILAADQAALRALAEAEALAAKDERILAAVARSVAVGDAAHIRQEPDYTLCQTPEDPPAPRDIAICPICANRLLAPYGRTALLQLAALIRTKL